MYCTRSCWAVVQKAGRHAVIVSGQGTSAGWPLALRVKAQLHFKDYVAALREYERDLPIVDQAEAEDGLLQFAKSKIKNRSKWTRAAVEAFRGAGYVPSSNLCAALLETITNDGVAASMLSDLSADEMQPDTNATVALIDSCTVISGPLQAEAVFAEHEASRLSSDSDNHPEPAVWAALIRSRALWGDIRGAEAWFHVWRTGPAHPLVPANANGGRKRQTWRSLEARSNVRGKLPTPSIGFSSSSFRRSNTLRLERLPRAAHTLANGPFPDPQPYLALLDGLIQNCAPDRQVNRHTRHPSLLQLVTLMAADRVRLTPQVISSLIDIEWARREAQWRESTLVLYSLISKSMQETATLDRTLFTRVLRAYTWVDPVGPVRNGQRRMEGTYQPTDLMKASGLKVPPAELLVSPRTVLRDMFVAHQRQPLLTCDIMNQALSACIHCQDFSAAAILLDALKRFGMSPTAATHKTLVHSLLLPRQGRSPFMHVGYRRQQSLMAHVDRLASQELALLPFDEAVEVVHVLMESNHCGRESSSNSTHVNLESLWPNAGAPVQQEPWQYILEHRDQLRDVEYLRDLLREAVPRPPGSSKFMAADAWQRDLAKAASDLGLSQPVSDHNVQDVVVIRPTLAEQHCDQI